MSVFYILIPVSIALAAVFVIACLYAIRRGQFDDLDSPPWRILFDESNENKDSKVNKANKDRSPSRRLDDIPVSGGESNPRKSP